MRDITNIKIVKAEYKDIESISELVQNVYIKHVSAIDTGDGKNIMLEYSSKKSIEERYTSSGCLLLIAKDNEKIVGMIEIKNKNHVSLCFVDENYFRQGIGSKLFSSVKEILGEIGYTVNSTPFAVSFYEGMGFKKLSMNIEMNNGIYYVPMEY